MTILNEYIKKTEEILKEEVSSDAILDKISQYFIDLGINASAEKRLINGKTIQIIDITGLKDDNLVLGYMLMSKYYSSFAPGSFMRELYKVSNIKFSREMKDVIKYFKKSFSHTKGKTAVIGLTGLQKIFIKTTSRGTKLFDKENKALEWLSTDSDVFYQPNCPKE